MRAVVLAADSTLRLDDRPLPVPGADEVVVELLRTGICGTDLGIYSGKIPVRHPLIMGHEMFGRVAASSGEEPVAGTRVIVDPALSCGRCFWCDNGQTNLCPQGALLGRDRDGGFAEQIAVPRENVHEVPAPISDASAPLLQVLAVCLHAQGLETALPHPSSIAIIGLGVSGLLHLQIAKDRGAATVGITRSASKRALAASLGADLTLPPEQIRTSAELTDMTEGRGPDLVIDCAGYIETLAMAVDLVRPGGRIIAFGTITTDHGTFPFYSLYLKELTIDWPRAALPKDFREAIRLVASGRVLLEPLISHTFPLERAQEAIEATTASDTLKVMLDHTGSAA